MDTNSHLMTKPYNFDIKAMIDTFFLYLVKGGGVKNFLLTVEIFFNKREYSKADWLVSLVIKATFFSEGSLRQKRQSQKKYFFITQLL